MSRAARRRPRNAATPGPGPNPELTEGPLTALAGVFAFGAVLWAGAAAATLLASGVLPDGGITAALSALAHLGEPAIVWGNPARVPGPVLYWSVSGLVVAVVIGAGLLGWRRWAPGAAAGSHLDRVRHLPGLASRVEAQRAAGRRPLLRRATVVRPSVGASPSPEQVGYRLGRSGGAEL